jgi:hypothetical protein
MSMKVFSVLEPAACIFPSALEILHIEVDRLTAYLLLHYSQSSRTKNPPYLHVGLRMPGIFLPQEFLLLS